MEVGSSLYKEKEQHYAYGLAREDGFVAAFVLHFSQLDPNCTPTMEFASIVRPSRHLHHLRAALTQDQTRLRQFLSPVEGRGPRKLGFQNWSDPDTCQRIL